MNTPQCIYTLYNALAVIAIMKIEPADSLYNGNNRAVLLSWKGQIIVIDNSHGSDTDLFIWSN